MVHPKINGALTENLEGVAASEHHNLLAFLHFFHPDVIESLFISARVLLEKNEVWVGIPATSKKPGENFRIIFVHPVALPFMSLTFMLESPIFFLQLIKFLYVLLGFFVSVVCRVFGSNLQGKSNVSDVE